MATPKAKRITPQKILKAIPGSKGLIANIAKKMGCGYLAVWCHLTHHKDDIRYQAVREAVLAEKEAFKDQAEETVAFCIKQKKDLATASATARWVLQHTRKEYAEKKTVTVEGGEIPLRVQSVVDVNLIPLDLRKQLMAALELQKEAPKLLDVEPVKPQGKKRKQ